MDDASPPRSGGAGRSGGGRGGQGGGGRGGPGGGGGGGRGGRRNWDDDRGPGGRGGQGGGGGRGGRRDWDDDRGPGGRGGQGGGGRGGRRDWDDDRGPGKGYGGRGGQGGGGRGPQNRGDYRGPKGRGGGPRGRGGPGGGQRGTTPVRQRDRDHGETRGLGGDRVEGRQAVKELLLAGTRPVRQVVLAADQDSSPILDDIIDLADEAGVDIRELPRGRFEQMAATDAPQGVVAFAAPLREYAIEELLSEPPAGPPNSLYLSAGAEHVEERTPAASADAGEEESEREENSEGAEETDAGESADAAEETTDAVEMESEPAERDDVADEEEPSDAAAQADPADADGTADRRAASAATLLLVLDGIVDPGNLGAILRTAECAGVTGVVLPRHRAARITPTVAKRAAGAIEHLRFAPVSGIPTALATLAEQGVWSVGLDVTADQTIWQLDLADAPLALVLGAEGRGLSRLVRRRCDVTTRIPTAGKLDSLNAAAAGSIALFEVMRRRAAP
ncbi:MAG: RNA methyltransferase [bacterium]|nr:RNA methyltransferase [bacterium]